MVGVGVGPGEAVNLDLLLPHRTPHLIPLQDGTVVGVGGVPIGLREAVELDVVEAVEARDQHVQRKSGQLSSVMFLLTPSLSVLVQLSRSRLIKRKSSCSSSPKNSLSMSWPKQIAIQLNVFRQHTPAKVQFLSGTHQLQRSRPTWDSQS